MKTHRDLRAWQSADGVAYDLHRWIDGHWQPARAAVYDQLRRAALSVSLNIAEGYASGPGARCRSHLRIAYGSAVETAELLDFLTRLGHDLGDIPTRAELTKALLFRLWQRSRPA